MRRPVLETPRKGLAAAVTQLHQFAGGEIDDRAIWFRTA